MAENRKRARKEPTENQSILPDKAAPLAAIGPKTKESAAHLVKVASSQFSLFSDAPQEAQANQLYSLLASHLTNWPDDKASEIVDAVSTKVDAQSEPPLDLAMLGMWINAHSDKFDSQGVVECIQISPPEQIRILKILSRAGSQKRVFAARWNLEQREVVIKSFIGA